MTLKFNDYALYLLKPIKYKQIIWKEYLWYENFMIMMYTCFKKPIKFKKIIWREYLLHNQKKINTKTTRTKYKLFFPKLKKTELSKTS